ncbi:MAG: metal-dependent hydrolase [Planctomycetota bacterium]|nr:metal-dependent hydrolase [Planctomycetota bacterium]
MMSPVSHFLISWVVANTVPDLDRRERAFIAVAGIAPDIDGFGAPFEILTKGTANELNWFGDYHHVLCHNGLFCIILALLAVYFARNRKKLVAFFVLLTSHAHLLCDLVGSQGPDGSHWPIPYFSPFNSELGLTWAGQWELNSWQNYSITAIVLVTTIWLAIRRGYSPVEIISQKADKVVVEAFQNRAKQVSDNYEQWIRRPAPR